MQFRSPKEREISFRNISLKRNRNNNFNFLNYLKGLNKGTQKKNEEENHTFGLERKTLGSRIKLRRINETSDKVKINNTSMKSSYIQTEANHPKNLKNIKYLLNSSGNSKRDIPLFTTTESSKKIIINHIKKKQRENIKEKSPFMLERGSYKGTLRENNLNLEKNLNTNLKKTKSNVFIKIKNVNKTKLPPISSKSVPHSERAQFKEKNNSQKIIKCTPIDPLDDSFAEEVHELFNIDANEKKKL